MVWHTNHVARVGRLSNLTVLGEEHERVMHINLFAFRGLQTHAALKLAGAQAKERYPVAVIRVHVRLDLEHEARNAFIAALKRMRLIFLLAGLRARRRLAVPPPAEAAVDGVCVGSSCTFTFDVRDAGFEGRLL